MSPSLLICFPLSGGMAQRLGPRCEAQCSECTEVVVVLGVGCVLRRSTYGRPLVKLAAKCAGVAGKDRNGPQQYLHSSSIDRSSEMRATSTNLQPSSVTLHNPYQLAGQSSSQVSDLRLTSVTQQYASAQPSSTQNSVILPKPRNCTAFLVHRFPSPLRRV